MKLPFVCGCNDLRLMDVDPPVTGPRDVVVAIASAGICGTDIGYVAMGGLTGKPMPLGHELSGTIVEVGAAVEHLALGQRVIVNPMPGMIGNGGSEGGFCERLLVRDVVGRPDSILLLPDHLDFDRAALIEPLAVAAHAIAKAQTQPHHKVAIYGAGPIGLAAIARLRQIGVTDIVVFDLSPLRRDLAVKIGAAAAIDPAAEAPAEVLKARHGTKTQYGVDFPATDRVLELTGAPVLEQIVGMVGPGTTICVTSVQKKPVSIDFAWFMAREITVTSSCGYGDLFAPMLEAVASGAIDPAVMITHRFDGPDFMAAFDQASDAGAAAKVVVQYAR